jgi:glycosyltransferase involved in cell wall biosynthesis
MEVVFLEAYPEGALLAIERAVEAGGEPFQVVSSGPRVAHCLIRLLSRSARSRLRARYINSVDDRLVLRSLRADVRMAMSTRSIFARYQSSWMYREHSNFARRADARLPNGVAVVFGLPGASLEVFHSRPGAFRVLHMVNGHPRIHNAALEGALSPAAHHELVPTSVALRVARELEICDLVLVPSNVVKAGLVLNGVRATKISVVPYGVSDILFCGELDHSKRDLDVLYIGQISYRKGVDVLIEAMRRCPLLRCYLAGPIVSSELLKELPENVCYGGRQGRQETAALMRRAKSFVVVSREDAYPLTALEALSSGCELVVSSEIGTMDLLSGRVVRVVQPGSISDLVQALQSKTQVVTLPGAIAAPWSWESYGEHVLEVVQKRRRLAV